MDRAQYGDMRETNAGVMEEAAALHLTARERRIKEKKSTNDLQHKTVPRALIGKRL